MMDKNVELLLHPVRLRIVRAMRVASELTTNELCGRLSDVPKATIYRHVERLLKGGVLKVQSEHKVRGVVERVYRLDAAATAIGPQIAQAMTALDHRIGFAATIGALIGDFNAYLDGDAARPFEDGVSYRQYIVWLSEDERRRMIDEFVRLVGTLASNEPGRGRAPYVLSPLFFPAAGRPQQPPTQVGANSTRRQKTKSVRPRLAAAAIPARAARRVTPKGK
jgi:DNA-binding transcriptional ArsR family regulator